MMPQTFWKGCDKVVGRRAFLCTVLRSVARGLVFGRAVRSLRGRVLYVVKQLARVVRI